MIRIPRPERRVVARAVRTGVAFALFATATTAARAMPIIDFTLGPDDDGDIVRGTVTLDDDGDGSRVATEVRLLLDGLLLDPTSAFFGADGVYDLPPSAGGTIPNEFEVADGMIVAVDFAAQRQFTDPNGGSVLFLLDFSAGFPGTGNNVSLRNQDNDRVFGPFDVLPDPNTNSPGVFGVAGNEIPSPAPLVLLSAGLLAAYSARRGDRASVPSNP